MDNAKYPPDKNCTSCSRHKIVWKLAYLRVKMTSLVLKHNIIRNCLSKCNKTVQVLSKSREKIVHFDQRQTKLHK